MSTAAEKRYARKIDNERKALAVAGRLHWVHWAIVILSAAATVAAWNFSRGQVHEKQQIQFDREAQQVVELVAERMKKYEDALWSGVAAIRALDGQVDHREWRAFAETLQIDTKYPGINGIGVIVPVERGARDDFERAQSSWLPDFKIYPDHDEAELMPIRFIEPTAPNRKAVGLDMAHEQNRYRSALKARRSGSAQITGPIVLVQDEGSTPGFLFYAPFYDGDATTESARDENFAGLVYAPFVVRKLMAGTLRQENRRVGIRLTDGSTVIYGEEDEASSGRQRPVLFARNITVPMYGRTWTFEIWANKTFIATTSNALPALILIGGMTIDALLLTIFITLSRTNQRSVRFAERMNRALIRKTDELAEMNGDLESFAYIASHDLKTPLRGITDLVEYVREDLQPYLESRTANPDIEYNLDRITQQTNRMERLIRGVLDYSGVGKREEVVEHVDVGSLLETLVAELDVKPQQLQLTGDITAFRTYRVRLEQVLSNLVGNAFKYHHDRGNALVQVTMETEGNKVRFKVADNGPGIDPRFHSRIFDVFQTLQPRDQIESTGVGLSIVKKAVESVGGNIKIQSTPGKGSSFMFEWPIVRETQTQEIAEVG